MEEKTIDKMLEGKLIGYHRDACDVENFYPETPHNDQGGRDTLVTETHRT